MSDKKHVTLVCVCGFRPWEDLYPPLGIAFLASNLRAKGYPVSLVDTTFHSEERIYESIMQQHSSLVGFQISVTNYFQSRVIIQRIRAKFPTLPIVLGGPLSTVLPEELLKADEIDFVLRGEGENAIVELMEHLEGERALSEIGGLCYKENGSSLINPPRIPISDLNTLPMPAYDLLPMDGYLKTPQHIPMSSPGTTLMASRGCYGNCIYCQPIVKKLFGSTVRRYAPGRIVEEMRRLSEQYKIKSLLFVDDDAFWEGEVWWYEVAELLGRSGLKIDFELNARVDTVDKPLLAALKRVGLKYIDFGVESGSEKILRNIKKGYSPDKIVPAFQLCRELGIVSRCNIMVGSPGESWETIRETLGMLSQARPDVISISVTALMPGSHLYESTVKSNPSKSFEASGFLKSPFGVATERFSRDDIHKAIKKIADQFLRTTLKDIFIHPFQKRGFISMLIAREISLMRIDPWLAFHDLKFHFGNTSRLLPQYGASAKTHS